MSQILFLGNGPAEVSYLGLSADGTTFETSWDSGSFNFGSAHGALNVVAAVHCVGTLSNPDPQVASATIKGVAASVIAGASSPSGGAQGLWWIGAHVPAGGSGNVVVNFDVSVTARIGIYRTLNLVSLTATDVGMNPFPSASSPASYSADADVRANGAYFSGTTVFNVDGVSFSGVTPDYNEPLRAAPERRAIGGFYLATSDQAGRVSTVTKSGSLAVSGVVGAISLR